MYDDTVACWVTLAAFVLFTIGIIAKSAKATPQPAPSRPVLQPRDHFVFYLLLGMMIGTIIVIIKEGH